MLSKVLRGDDADGAQPISWRQMARSATAATPSAPVSVKQQQPPAHPPTPQPGQPPPAAPPHSAAPGPEKPKECEQHEAQIKALQARVLELEQLAEVKARQARDNAYREGENAGRAQATAEIQPLLERLAHSIREVAELRPKLRHEAETDLLTLAFAISKKVLHREVTADPEALSALVSVALDKVRVQEILRVRLHPQHHAPVQQMLARIAGNSSIDLIPDGRLPLGGIIVETTRGEFDVSVDTQLREIERGLTDRLKSRS